MAIVFSTWRGVEKKIKVILMADTMANELGEYWVFTVWCGIEENMEETLVLHLNEKEHTQIEMWQILAYEWNWRIMRSTTTLPKWMPQENSIQNNIY